MHVQKIAISHSWTDVSVNIQTKQVAYRLSENKEVLFITQARIGQPVLQVNKNLTVLEWPHKRPTKPKDLLFMLRLLKKEKPDAVIAHFGGTNVMMIAAWLAGIKHRICWMHTLTEQNKLDVKSPVKARWNIFKRSWVYSLATHVVVLNGFGQKDAIENYKIRPSKVVKIYNGIEPSAETNHNNGERLLVRFLGRLAYSKGVDLLIQAFEQVLQQVPNAQLEFVGKGDMRNQLEQMIEEKRLQNHIRFHPQLAGFEEVYKVYASSYCVVVPSRLDNFPTVVLEAFSTQTPVIAAATGGIVEMVQHNKSGLLFEKENVEDLARQLIRMLTDKSLRNQLATAGKQKFEQEFSMQKHVHNVQQFIENLP
jgi:glycosyltransferase involved in cell wall biosynthesis